MMKFTFATLLLLSTAAFAQAPHNSVTLNWTNPSAYQGGQPLTVGQVSVYVDGGLVQQSGVINAFTSDVLAAGPHTFNVVVCDNMSPANCSPMSNTAMVTIPSVVLVVPAVSDLSATVN